MPHLDEWCAFEEEYSNSLSEAIQALLNTSIQLPIGGNVKVSLFLSIASLLYYFLTLCFFIASNPIRFIFTWMIC